MKEALARKFAGASFLLSKASHPALLYGVDIPKGNRWLGVLKATSPLKLLAATPG
jgi:hypothetical protein